jgi:hypothetical protein
VHLTISVFSSKHSVASSCAPCLVGAWCPGADLLCLWHGATSTTHGLRSKFMYLVQSLSFSDYHGNRVRFAGTLQRLHLLRQGQDTVLCLLTLLQVSLQRCCFAQQLPAAMLRVLGADKQAGGLESCTS